MKIYLNGNEIGLESKDTIETLLQRKELNDATGIAIAVNENVIPKTNWSKHQLFNEDKVTVITATAGG